MIHNYLFSLVHLMTFSVTPIIQLSVIQWLVNNDLERIWTWPNLQYYPGIRVVESGFSPWWKIFSGSAERADWQGEKKGNKADSIIHKMANGHNCHQHDKSLPNFHRERQKDMQQSRAPDPLPDRQAPVICIWFLPSHQYCHAFTLSEWGQLKKNDRNISLKAKI